MSPSSIETTTVSAFSTDDPPALLAPVPHQVAVIGAGLSGLVVAWHLTEAGFSVRVFDQEPHPGGRLATHHEHWGTFDHGAPYFTARKPRFQHMVRTWVEQGHAAEWHGRFGLLSRGTVTPETAGPVRYVGVPDMSAVARQLASRVDLRCGVRVKRVHRESDAWLLTSQADEVLGPFETVAVAIPLPQAVPLLSEELRLKQFEARVHMEPCWVVMVDFDAPVPLPLDGVFIQDSPLSWAARDSSKPGRPAGERWVLHATPDFTWPYFEDKPLFVARMLIEAFAQAARLELRPRAAMAHLWLHARPTTAPIHGAIVDLQRGLGLCGDWCSSPDVEGAFLSGVTLARQLAMFLSEQ